MTDEILSEYPYHTRSMVVKPGDTLFSYCDTVTALANNLENAVLYRIRQVMFAVIKPPDKLSVNEREILDEIENALPLMGDKYNMPTADKFFLGYDFIEKLLSVTKNRDRFAARLSNHTAQNAIKSQVRNVKSYFAALREWKLNPSKFTGEPELPDYHHKGGRCTATISNQEGKLYTEDGKWQLKLPYRRKKEERVSFGPVDPNLLLKEVKIVPSNGTYIIAIVLQSKEGTPQLNEKPERIAAIDPGIDNLMAVTNNCGLQSILYKGGVIKSINQYFNKQAAKIISAQAVGTDKKFVPTDEYYHLLNRRNNQIKDILHKTGKHFVQWCVENRIDTVVMGHNPGWKQEVELGDKTNQNFVQIPFAKLQEIIRYLCERNGIRYIDQEESYTSKASFLDGDYIPTKGVDDDNAKFSGKRRPTRYKGNYKKNGFRGLYTTSDGTIINADLNGSANILRKAIPDAFKNGVMPDFRNGVMPDFSKPVIIKHVEAAAGAANKIKQTAVEHVTSKSKEKRLEIKRRKSKGNPTGIVLCG